VANEPHTGYGYIKRGERQDVGYSVDEFVEKPANELAQDDIS
jgi:mannose-1-phosphate guanylyltransferase/mannose-6-phosphate isomerase